jgi:hypothetical protein
MSGRASVISSAPGLCLHCSNAAEKFLVMNIGQQLTEDTMAQVDWHIEGVEFSNCNCDYACPCQFESHRPTHGDCRGFAAVRIDKGHFGDVRSMVSAELSFTPGRARSTRATASVRPSSTSGETASSETLLRRSCTAAKRTRERRTGGSIGRCRVPSIPRCSSPSSSM